jgi:hypothetical protein
MKIIYTSVHSLRWANREKNLINCIVKFNHLKEEVPFTAASADSEPHGREIFKRCISGDFGPIADYQPENLINSDDINSKTNLNFENVEELNRIKNIIDQVNKENETGSIRGIILVWSSIIEESLSDIIKNFLIDHTNSDELFKIGAIFNTFDSKIKTCFSLGLISYSEMKTCQIIQKIRNKVAHQWNVDLENRDFSNSIKDNIKKLYDQYHSERFNWEDKDLLYMTRMFYALSCAMLMMQFLQRKGEAKAKKLTELKNK